MADEIRRVAAGGAERRGAEVKTEWFGATIFMFMLGSALVVVAIKLGLLTGILQQSRSQEDEPLESVSIEEEESRCSLACEYAEPGGS